MPTFIKTQSLSVLICVLVLRCAASMAAEANLEKLPLFTPQSLKKWSLAEATLDASTLHTKSGNPAMHWHVTVDYYAGEPKYPIGWPRITHPIVDASQRDWSAWDYLHLWIYTATTRDSLPHDPATLTIYNPERQGAYQFPLTALKKDAWVEINIPVSDIPRPQDIRLMQFNISEALYRHQDKVDFYIDDLSLVRYAEPTLLSFSAENAVEFSDVKSIPVTFKLTGVSRTESTEITFEIRQNKSIKSSTRASLKAGEARISLPAGKGRLPAGVYDIVANVPKARAPFVTQVRLVDSPWK